MTIIDYYIDMNNITYIDNVKEEERENDDQINENEIRKEW